jgi:hypothetical protein
VESPRIATPTDVKLRMLEVGLSVEGAIRTLEVPSLPPRLPDRLGLELVVEARPHVGDPYRAGGDECQLKQRAVDRDLGMVEHEVPEAVDDEAAPVPVRSRLRPDHQMPKAVSPQAPPCRWRSHSSRGMASSDSMIGMSSSIR